MSGGGWKGKRRRRAAPRVARGGGHVAGPARPAANGGTNGSERPGERRRAERAVRPSVGPSRGRRLSASKPVLRWKLSGDFLITKNVILFFFRRVLVVLRAYKRCSSLRFPEEVEQLELAEARCC